jgi:beta-galactosidase GanA
MRFLTFLAVFLAGSFALVAQSYKPPHLEKKGNTVQVVVKDKPFLALGGELHNSTVSGAAYMRPVWALMKQKRVNTVLAPVYWELVEPTEGTFDFSLVDSMIAGDREQNLHLGILWFGAFKTTYSTYVPTWVKTNTEKYPRAMNKQGEALPVLSTFSAASLQANANALTKLMKHIRQVDEKEQTVILVQVENEVGLFNSPRDYSPQATTAYNEGVPADLMRYLGANKGKLQPEIDSAWKATGYKTSGSWEAVFGKSVLDEKNPKVLSYLPEELFSAYHYTKFVGQLAAAGKEAYPIPMFVNAWPKAIGFTGVPGKYPSGGPVPHTLDFWRANAPAIAFITPNVYASKQGIYTLVEQYHRSGNPVFIPEIKQGLEAANLAFWIYGQHDAIGVAPFGIDAIPADQDPFTKTFAVLAQVQGLILQHQGKGTMAGLFVDSSAASQTVALPGYTVKADLVVPRGFAGAAPAGKKTTMAGGLVFALGPDEFLAVGKDYELTFTPTKTDPKKAQVDVEFLEEGSFVNDKWITTRRLNGDEGTGGGSIGSFALKNTKVGTLRFPKTARDEYSLVRIKFYRY